MYTTTDAITLLLPERDLLALADDQAVGDLADPAVQAVLQEAVDQADREIDSYLSAAGHSVPLDPVPPLVANMSAKLAVVALFRRTTSLPEQWQDEARQVRRLLEQIMAGRLRLGAPEEGGTAAAEPAAGITTNANTPLFPHSVLDKF